jgi:hypothetical protein
MLGLMYLCSAALYVALIFFVVRWAWRSGRTSGGSKVRGASFGAIGFLAVYLPVFWNLVPTIFVHRYYCERDAGLFVQMQADKWYANNQAKVELINKLPRNLREATSPTILLPDGFSRFTHFNDLLASDFKSEQLPAWSVDLRRQTWRTVDARTGAILASVIDYQTGRETDLRFWLRNSTCFNRRSFVDAREGLAALLPLDKLFAYESVLKGEKK